MASNLLRSAAVRAGLQSASIMTAADVATQLAVEKRSMDGTAPQDERAHAHQTAALPSPPGAEGDGVRATSPNALYYDPMRTLRWAAVGLTLHGPYFLHAFGRLDKMLGGGTALVHVAKKTAAAQLVIFPPYLVALFSYMGVLEGSSNAEEVASKVRQKVPEAFVGGCAFWPVANFVNFSLVPAGARVPYVAAVGGLWNGYLSHMNASEE